MTLLRLAIVTSIVLAGVGVVWRIAPSKSRLELNKNTVHFPLVSGQNLQRKEFVFPRDFEGEFNLVMIPFKQNHQLIVNTWIPFAQDVEASFPGFVYYELPTIYEMPTLSRTFINEGMRAGIPDQTSRDRTITLYLNKEEFKTALDIPTENDIFLFIVDRQGSILWRAEGEFTPEKGENLVTAVKELLTR